MPTKQLKVSTVRAANRAEPSIKAPPNTAIDASNQRLREGRELDDRYVSISE